MTTITQVPVSASAITLTKEEFSETARSKTKISVSAAQAINAAVQEKIGEDLALIAGNNDEKNNFSSENAPAIRQPTTSLTSKANVLKLMAQYQSLTNELDSHELKNRLSGYIAAKQAKSNQMEKLSDEYLALSDELDVLEKELQKSSGMLDDAAKKVDSAKTKLEAAQKSLDSLLKKLGVDSANDPAVVDNQEVLSAVQKIKIAEVELKNANAFFQLVKESHTQLLQKTDVVMQSYLNKIDEMEKASDQNTINNLKTNSDNMKEALTRMAMMIQLITEFINLIDEASEAKLKKDLEINRKQLEARQAEMKRKADEQEEKIRKAEQLQKILGCLGTIVGWTLVTIGAVTTVFGGIGTPLAVLGITLLSLDIITEAITGESLTGMAVNWLMENVILPIAKIVDKIRDKVMEMLGINKLLEVIGKAVGFDLLGLVKNVMSAVTTIAIYVGMAIIAKSLIKTLIKKLINKLIQAIVKTVTSMVSKIANKIANSFIKAISKGRRAISKAANEVIDKIKQLAEKINKFIFNHNNKKTPEMIRQLQEITTKRLQQVTGALGFSNAVVSTSLNIAIADIRLQANKSMADFYLAQTDYEILKKMLTSIINKFQNDREDINLINKMLNNSIESSARVSKFIAHNIRA
ncbi:type III secretion system translocon subunit SctE [Kalamiella sp. sgz302252]|uniref:type III secretion system translocon subunit SctE n=1 Tax=Pantoea sp. sgz302252 TaxID=3341827 RepID=UPI0036D227D4